MKKLITYIVFTLFCIVLHGQKPTLDCTQKEPFRTASPTIILKDSIAQPSDSLGHIPNGPEKNLGDKVVFFLHGLGGGVTSWGRANSFTYGNYKTVTSRPVYNQSEDFEIAWVDLNQRFRDVNLDEIQADPDYDRLSSIVIAHSLGGVVTRYIDQKYVTENFQREFGGFATFGGPHAGAPIIDNFNAGLVQEYFDESCNVMSRPYILEFYTELENGIINFLPGSIKALFTNGILSFLYRLRTTLVDDLPPELCDAVSGAPFSAFAESVNPYIGNELSPSSDVIQGLADFTSPVPGIAFYGVEDDPVSWRELYSLTNDVNQPAWGEANEDSEYIEEANRISNELFMKYEYYSMGSIFFEIGIPGYLIDLPEAPEIFYEYGCSNAACVWCNLQGLHFNEVTGQCEGLIDVSNPELAQAFYDAYIWWNDFDRSYRILFGFLDINLVETISEETECNCYFTINGEWELDDSVSEPCSEFDPPFNADVYQCIDENITTYSNVETSYPNDGVVPAYSAKSFPGAVWSVELPGSNHQQMRNDANTKIQFKKMYDGDYGERFEQVHR